MRLKDLLQMSHPGNEDKLKGLDPILPTVTFVGGFDRLVRSESKENLSQTHAAAAPELALSLCHFL